MNTMAKIHFYCLDYLDVILAFSKKKKIFLKIDRQADGRTNDKPSVLET